MLELEGADAWQDAASVAINVGDAWQEISTGALNVIDVWEETFNSTCIMDYCNIENKSIQMFVNNVVNADYELYRIKNRDDIIIDYR